MKQRNFVRTLLLLAALVLTACQSGPSFEVMSGSLFFKASPLSAVVSA
jgi:uncharacterized protein YcfL